MEYGGPSITSSDTLTLGTNDSSVSQSNPNINTTNGAISFGTSGTFNFYDGKINSGSSLTLNVDNLPSSYSITYSNSNKTAMLTANSNIVATNTSITPNRNYTDLQTAITCASSGNTLQLKKSFTISSALSVPSGKTINLNTNGYTLTSSYTSGSAITNSGTLNISGSGTIKSTGSTTIQNLGTMTVGTTTETNSVTISTTNSSNYYAINNTGTLTVNKGTITASDHAINDSASTSNTTINGGSISGYRAIITYGTTTINGGTIQCSDDTSGFGVVVQSGATFNVKGGTVTSSASGWDESLSMPVPSQTIRMNGGTVNVSGGTIESLGKIGTPVVVTSGAEFNMTNGTIRCGSEFSALLKARYNACIEVESGGVANIKGGTINNNNTYGISVTSNGKLTLGINDSSISTSSPSIYGLAGGVLNYGTFNFYDGVISSSFSSDHIDVIYGTGTVNTPSGYKVGYFDTGTKAKLISSSVKAINETTGTTYTSLTSAISAASAGDTVSMQSDATVSSAISISKNLDLCLNIYTLSSSSTSSYVISNSANLDIVGYGSILSSGYRAINNTGNLRLDTCTIQTTASSQYAIYNASSSKTLQIYNSAKVIGTSIGVYMYTGILDFSSGTITGGTSYGVQLTSGTKINMSGGTITTNSTSTSSSALYIAAATANITGGKVSNATGRGIYISNSSSSKLTFGGSSNTLNTTNPKIEAGTYGIYSAGTSSVISFYNGIIKGKTAAINSTSYIDNKRSGCTLTSGTDGDYKTLKLT